jgi:TfoX/Sxy family transcriptional regulator of competence genes
LYPNPELSLPSKDNPLLTNPERKAISFNAKEDEKKKKKKKKLNIRW